MSETLMQMELRHVRERREKIKELQEKAFRAGQNDWARPNSVPNEIDLVTNEIAILYGVEPKDLRGPRRHSHLIEPRRVIWRELITKRGVKSTRVGRYFNRDHSTILQGIKALNELEGRA